MSYAMYEFMFDLKVAYKKCIELYYGNMDHFNRILSSKTLQFILNTYEVFISPVLPYPYINDLYDKILLYNNFKDRKNFIESISSAMLDIFSDEYNYHGENFPSLSSGKFFLNNPQLTSKCLFYKKMDRESYLKQFINTPLYRTMDLLANYEEVV
jgi:hypothetical protein